MKPDRLFRSVQTPISSAQQGSTFLENGSETPIASEENSHEGWVYRAIWYLVNGALAVALLLVIYSTAWEYSTRRYLKGFSDAIVPVSASPVEKIDAILTWMSHGPARNSAGPDGMKPDRDPTETLNYNALLRVCGTATNAFINLTDSGGLEARRLLLLDSRRQTKHVSAEVLVDGRWIVVDPAFRAILRGADGQPLTRSQLVDPGTFAAATRGIAGYDPNYSYESTVHIRIGRLRFVGKPLRWFLDRVLPGWEESSTVSLIAERASLAAMWVTILSAILILFVRLALRWYGERRLGVHPTRLRQQIRRAFHAFVDTAG